MGTFVHGRLKLRRAPPRQKRRLRRAGSVDSEDLDAPDRGLEGLFDEDEDDRDEGPSNRRGELGDDFIDADGLDDFIEEDEFDDDDEARADKRSKVPSKAARPSQVGRQKDASRLMGALAPNVSGISKDSWEEVLEVFGNGEEYLWAMDEDEEMDDADVDGEVAIAKQVRLRDIFEPSELKERMLTDADEAIRLLDVPERTQLLSAGLAFPISAEGRPEPLLTEQEVDDAALWFARKISDRCTQDFMTPLQSGYMPLLHDDFLKALRAVVGFFMRDYLEVPFVWAHRRDYLNHYDPNQFEPSQRSKYFLSRDDLWRVYSLCFKFRAMIERKRGLWKLYEKLQLPEPDLYFQETFQVIDSVEEATDLTQWLRAKYATEFKNAQADWQEADDLDADLGPDAERDLGVGRAKPDKPVKYKKAARDSRYERALNSQLRQLAQNVGIAAHELATDHIGGNKMHFTEDPEVDPLEYADQYAIEGTEFSDAQKALEGESALYMVWQTHPN